MTLFYKDRFFMQHTYIYIHVHIYFVVVVVAVKKLLFYNFQLST